METFNKTSNVAIVVVEEKTTKTAINNFEAHIKQVVLSGNAMEEYKKYNYSFPTDFRGEKYRRVIDTHLKKGTKFDKSLLGDADFWVGRTYKKSSGKTTTFIESMTIAPPFKIHPDQIDAFMESIENGYFSEMVDFLKNDEHFKDCLFLDFIVHMDEVYIPETITLPDGTEKMLEEEERWKYAYIKPHMHISYIPTVRVYDDKTGVDYLKLSRKDVWHSDKGFNHSYSEFIDRKYQAVDMHYGFDRGEVYEQMPEEEKPVHLGLEEWKHKNDQARIDRLISQQKNENKKMMALVMEQAEQIEGQRQINENVAMAMTEGLEAMMDDAFEDMGGEVSKIDYLLLKGERKMFADVFQTIRKWLEPYKTSDNIILKRICKLIDEVLEKLRANDLAREKFQERAMESKKISQGR